MTYLITLNQCLITLHNEYKLPTIQYCKNNDNKFDIEIALENYNKKDINVTSENNMLVIESKKDEKTDDKDNRSYINISKRYFKKSFTIADDVEYNAELKDVSIKSINGKIIPELKN